MMPLVHAGVRDMPPVMDGIRLLRKRGEQITCRAAHSGAEHRPAIGSRGGLRVSKVIALVGLSGNNHDLLRVELELRAGGAQRIDRALGAFRIGVQTIEGVHCGPSSTT